MSVIKKTRESKGFTQQELAKQSGLSMRTIQQLEASNKEPKGHTLTVLSQVFKMDSLILQTHCRSVEKTKKSETTTVRLINLSVLSFLGIPFGNIILPFILWRKHRKSKFVDELKKHEIKYNFTVQ